MFAKAYTAILKNKTGTTKAIDIFVRHGDEKSPEELKDKHPGFDLIALVPGQHARWSYLYDSNESKDASRKKSSEPGSLKDIDVWDTSSYLED